MNSKSLLVVAALSAIGAAPAASPVQRWAPAPITSAMFESHPAFDPRNGDLYFVRSSPKFEGWRIKLSHCGAQGWSEPVDAPFAGDGVEADPWFAPGGTRLYFISNRSTDGVHRKDMDLWRVDRGRDGRWGEPQRLPAPVNSDTSEWFPRFAPDGWLYFGSGRPGGLGKTDIWRAREDGRGGWTVENAGPALNSAAGDYEALPSPDGRRMIVESDDGLYESRRKPQGWAPRVRLGPAVNVNGSEIGSLFSPSGRSLMFARDTGQPDSGELFVWRISGTEAWPPKCPR